MAIRTYDILLDSYNSTMPEPIVGRQGDKNGAVTLHVTITDRGTAVDLTGQTVNLIAETAKGTAVVADNAGVTLTDTVNGKFDYAIPNALWSEAGKIKKAYFSLNNTDGQQTTYDLIFIVKKAIDISQEKADDYITVIDGTIRDLKTKSDDYIAVIDGTVRDLQSKVDAIYATYQAGDFYSKTESDSRFYSKAQTDDKDAATLTSAKTYADSGDSVALTKAKTYADTQDAATLASAKSQAIIDSNSYTDAQLQTVVKYVTDDYLGSEANINDLKTNGTYKFEGTINFVGAPRDIAGKRRWGQLEVFNAANVTFQKIYTNENDFYFRVAAGIPSTWRAWRRVQMIEVG